MDFNEKRSILAWVNEEALLATGFEDALIGYVSIFNKTVALYESEKCVQILVGQGMSEEEAENYFEFNVQGAWVGDGTPAFAVLFRPSQPEAPRVDACENRNPGLD